MPSGGEKSVDLDGLKLDVSVDVGQRDFQIGAADELLWGIVLGQGPMAIDNSPTLHLNSVLGNRPVLLKGRD